MGGGHDVARGGQQETCPECGGGGFRTERDGGRYRVLYHCPDCGYEGQDGYEDLYGCMAVPWGYLL
jgi:predicted RNA-binding Zn-ribbon protein involved in translation (DUF1610 family)